MEINYLGNIPLPGIGQWKTNALADWMHPKHGPLPDYVGLLTCDEFTFKVALWGTPEATLATVELQDDYDAFKHPDVRGSILYSIRWTVDEDHIKCWNHRFLIPKENNNKDIWQSDLAKKLMIESVRVAATTNIDGKKI